MEKTIHPFKPTFKTQTYEEFQEEIFGKEGSSSRMIAEEKIKSYEIGSLLKEKRKQKGMTQSEVASRINADKGYVSRIESGQIDVQISTVYKFVEQGLGLKLRMEIE